MLVGSGGGVHSAGVIFSRIERPRWWPVELNDRHLRSHGKIGDCEQSRRNVKDITKECSKEKSGQDLCVNCPGFLKRLLQEKKINVLDYSTQFVLAHVPY